MQRAILILAATFAAFLGAGCVSDDAEICGRVVKVAAGDTITVLDAANVQHKIRLNGIDAPESHQAFGQKSKQHLSSLVFCKYVRVKYKSRDKYGRILGTVYVDGLDINLEMLRAGLAWHYKRFDSTPAYAAAELEAWQNRRGLWSDPNPTPPEQFRHDGRARTPAAPHSPSAAPTAAAWSGKAVRLIGFGIANFQSSPDDGQPTLFADPKDESRRKRERLSAVLDDLRSRGMLGA